MTLLASGLARGRPGRQDAYRTSFIRQVHRLLAEGYRQLSPPSLQAREEPAITGLLVAAMRSWIDSAQAPRWAGRYAVHDDPPVQDRGAEGRRRPRVDIKIESTRRRPHPRFQLEAKRLRGDNPKSVSQYLGADGLGSFLASRYAAGYRDAGMLAYVQSGSPGGWAGEIHGRLCADREQYSLAPDCPGLERQSLEPALAHCYRTSHLRPAPVDVHHIFLSCY